MKQIEYFGLGSIKNIKDLIAMYGAKDIFIVKDRKSYEISGAKSVLDPLLNGYNVTFFDDFSENPKIEDVEKGIELYKRQKRDLIIGIGGGSAIDIAKLINILSVQESNPRDYITSIKQISKKALPLIAIPTTAGSGSEATHFAVVYINKRKYSLESEFLLADAVILDPQFTLSLPSYITASTGMDAFCQAVESYWCVNSTDESKNYAKEAVRLVLENLSSAVNNPTYEARTKMLKAAYLAGKAINITKTTAPHALSYAITSNFGVNHGHAVALTLGEFFTYNYQVKECDIADRRGVEYVRRTIEELNGMLGCTDALSSKEKIKRLMQDIGLKTSFVELNIKTNKDLQIIVENINVDRLENNPRRINKESLMNILIKQGQPIMSYSQKDSKNRGAIRYIVFCIITILRFFKRIALVTFQDLLFLLNHIANKKNVVFEITAPNEYCYIEPIWTILKNNRRIKLYLSVFDDENITGLPWAKYASYLKGLGISRANLFPAYITNSISGIDLFLSPTTYTYDVPKGNIPKIQILHSMYVKPRILLEGNLLAFNILFLSGPNLKDFFYNHFINKYPKASQIELFEVGYPKSDSLINGGYDRKIIRQALGIDSKKPVVIYAPTYDASLPTMGKDIITILASMDIFLIVKLHPASFRSTSNVLTGGVDWKLEMLKYKESYSNVIPIFEADINPYLVVSDIMVTDVSSVAYEFMLLDKPVIFIYVDEYFKKYSAEEIASFGMDAGLIVEDLKYLSKTVTRALNNPMEHSINRKEYMRKQIYYPGKSTEIAVQNILKLLFSGNKKVTNKRRMRIGIDARQIVINERGISVYIYNLIKNMLMLQTDHEYYLYIDTAYEYAMDPKLIKEKLAEFTKYPNVKVRDVKSHGYILWEQVYLPLAALRDGIDVLHMTRNRSPYFCHCPIVNTIHDTIALEWIARYDYCKEKNIRTKFYHFRVAQYLKFIFYNAFKKSSVIIAISNKTKKEIVDILKIDVNKISVITHGIDGEFHNLHLAKKYIMTFGGTAFQKNPEGPIEAYSNLPQRIKQKYPLLIVGCDNIDKEKELIKKYGVENAIIKEFVSKQELVELYNQTKVFLFLSIVEGFGLPPLEAMACGAVPIVYNISPMKENVNNEKLCVTLKNNKEVAILAEQIIDSDELHGKLVSFGMSRAGEFLWEKCALKHLEVYNIAKK